jgi:hypothetical protein
LLVEGTKGRGDDFMIGRMAPIDLPFAVDRSIRDLHSSLSDRLGPVRLEWVHDGSAAWVVQLHRGQTPSHESVIYDSDVSNYTTFEVGEGIEKLRALIDQISGTGTGITLLGDVGITSHMGDLLRKAKVPSRIRSSPEPPPVVQLSLDLPARG